MDEDTRLRNAVQWRKTRKSSGAVRLDQAVRELIDEKNAPRQARYSQVNEAWSQ